MLVCEICERLSHWACAELPSGLVDISCVGIVQREVRGGCVVNIGTGVRAFLPDRKSGIFRGNPRFGIGDEIEVTVEKIDRSREELLLSRLPIIAKLAQFSLGQVVIGRAESIADFGVFLRAGGALGLIHKSELVRGDVEAVAVVAIGQEIEVEVVAIDLRRGRIAFSRRNLLPTPWEYAEREWPAGSLVTCEVVSIVPYGAFVRLPVPRELGSFQGLVHLSEMDKHYLQEPADVVYLGQTLKVRVMSYREDRVQLSMRGAK